MSVKFDSSSSKATLIGGLEDDETLEFQHVATTMGEDLCGLVAVQVTSGVNLTGANLAATWGDEAMSLVSSGMVRYDSNECFIALYSILNPPTGPKDIEIEIASVPNELAGRGFMACAATYTGVASVGAAVTKAAGGFTTTPFLTINGVAEAYRTVVAFGVDGLFFGDIKATNANKRAQAISVSTGELWLVDAEGSPNQVVTATINNSDHWAVAGVVLSPSVVTAEASQTITAVTDGRAGLSREAPPHKSRYYLVPPA